MLRYPVKLSKDTNGTALVDVPAEAHTFGEDHEDALRRAVDAIESALILDVALVALLGGLLSVAELMSRYRDEPLRAVSNPPAVLYVVINVGAAVLALGAARLFGWSFGVDPSQVEQLRWTQVTAAGLGAMALFRSSLINVRVSGQDIGVGPGTLLASLLETADRAVDRLRARQRAFSAAPLMRGISFAKAYVALPTYCVHLMQNLSERDQEELASRVKDLADTEDMDDHSKALALGLLLFDVLGENVVAAAIEGLGDTIHEDVLATGRAVAPPPV